METGVGIQFTQILKRLGQDGEESGGFSSLTLAYLGDAVYELVIRSLVTGRKGGQVKKLHRETTGMVQASAQSEMMRAIQPILTGEEHAVYRRARNTRTVSPAKHQTLTDYRRATGFEALLGWLYLQGDWDRILELVQVGLEQLRKSRADREEELGETAGIQDGKTAGSEEK